MSIEINPPNRRGLREPAQFQDLVVTDQNGKEWHGITYSKERGYFEPITNGRCVDVGIEVKSWRYAPGQFEVGAMRRDEREGRS